jgi:hypothetical protein
MQRLLIHESEVNPTRMVGKGSFGEVFLADYRGTTVAVKTLKVGGAQNVYNDERAVKRDNRRVLGVRMSA